MVRPGARAPRAGGTATREPRLAAGDLERDPDEFRAASASDRDIRAACTSCSRSWPTSRSRPRVSVGDCSSLRDLRACSASPCLSSATISPRSTASPTASRSCIGRIVELAPRAELFARPSHPYTQALLARSRAWVRQRAGYRPKGEVADPLARRRLPLRSALPEGQAVCREPSPRSRRSRGPHPRVASPAIFRIEGSAWPATSPSGSSRRSSCCW